MDEQLGLGDYHVRRDPRELRKPIVLTDEAKQYIEELYSTKAFGINQD